MKAKAYIQILAIVLMIVLIGLLGARAADKPGIELGEVVVVTGKVVAIDRTDRSLAVLGPEGNILVLEVGKAAKNFNQIKVGDQVKLEYYEAVAIQYMLQRMASPPQQTSGWSSPLRPKG